MTGEQHTMHMFRYLPQAARLSQWGQAEPPTFGTESLSEHDLSAQNSK